MSLKVETVPSANIQNNQTNTIEQPQAKDSKCCATAKKVGKCIKDTIARYFNGWKDLFLSVKNDWNRDKVIGVIKGIGVGVIVFGHVIAIAAIIAGIALLATGAAGAGLLVSGAILLPISVLAYARGL